MEETKNKDFYKELPNEFKYDDEIEYKIKYIRDILSRKECIRYIKGPSYVAFYLPYLNVGEYMQIPFIPNSYFTSDIDETDFVGDKICLYIISILLDKSLLSIIETSDYYARFVDLLFDNLSDVLFWTKKYKIVEVYDFLKNLLTLRRPAKIKNINSRTYIDINGGMKYIYDRLAEYITIHACHYPLGKRFKSELDEYIKSINKFATPNNTVENFIHLIKSHLFKDYQKNAFINVITNINYFRKSKYFKFLNQLPEANLNLILLSNQKVYSHFLWAYGNAIEFTYTLQKQTLIDNNFYNKMITAIDLLPSDIGEMLKANLYILNQSV